MEKLELNQTNLEAYQIGVNDLVMFQQKLAEKRRLFEEENKEIIGRISKLSEELDLEQSQFKERAFDIYSKTKKKQLIGGLGIRVGFSLQYEDKKAFQWAVNHALCLSLNKREFDKIAKTQDIEFVEKIEKVTVTFPKEIKF